MLRANFVIGISLIGSLGSAAAQYPPPQPPPVGYPPPATVRASGNPAATQRSQKPDTSQTVDVFNPSEWAKVK